MPASYAVDLAELQDKVQEMTDFEAKVEEALAHLDQVVQRLHVTFTGEAAVAHRTAHDQWASGMREMRAGLGEIRAAAERAHQNYDAAVQANARMWESVR